MTRQSTLTINEVIGVGSTPEEAIADMEAHLPRGKDPAHYRLLEIGEPKELQDSQYAIGAKYVTRDEKKPKGKGFAPGMEQIQW